MLLSSHREVASSNGRPYSPSAASSVDTRLAPSLFTLDLGYITGLEQERSSGSSSRSPFGIYADNMRRARNNDPSRARSEPWCVPVRLVAGKYDEHIWNATVALDSQCMYNLVSMRTIKKQALTIEESSQWHVANTTTGEPVYSVGSIDMRLWCRVKIKSRLGRAFAFEQRYYNMRFQVVESDDFDVIIGYRSLEEEQIFTDQEIRFRFDF